MKGSVIFFMFVCVGQSSWAQNLITNNSFESNGQSQCSGWFTECGEELTFLCSGAVNSTCNGANYGAQLFQDAPWNGGQYCMRLSAFGTGHPGTIRTSIYGNFKGVFELKVWMRKQGIGARGDVAVYYKWGSTYTGMSATACYSDTWTQVVIVDTIKTLSDTIGITLGGTETIPGSGDIAYADLVQLTIKENWLGLSEVETGPSIKMYDDEMVTFEVVGHQGKEYMFSVYNTLGEMVIQPQAMPNGKVSFARSLLTTGAHFYRITSGQALTASGSFLIR